MHSPTPATPKTASLESASHLVILQHGLLGSKHDFDRFAQLFHTHLEGAEDCVYVHAAESNGSGFFKTFDGIDQGGERLATEIQQVATQMPHLQKLSMIGHSLGGLYNRYCIGVLFSRGFFDKIEPVNFVTMAAPHLGSRRPRRGATNAVFNALMPKMFSRTGGQLTLMDTATTETQALSSASSAVQNTKFCPALSDVKGSLLVGFPASEKQPDNAQEVSFELFDCVLSDRKLRVYESQEKVAENKAKLEIDMSSADVKIILPSRKSADNGASSHTSFIGPEQRGSIEKSNESGNFDIHIRWSANETEPADADVCVLRIPEADIHREWRWLVALSNAAFGVRCLTFNESTDEATRQVSTASPLLSCMTRGQFMQALQMFKVRALYSNIFLDMQVPYTCAAIRAFNPYRSSAEKCLMSPIYKHIASASLKGARQLRDTIPRKTKHLASRKTTIEGASLASPSNMEDVPHSDHDAKGDNIDSTSRKSYEGMAERNSLAASSGSGRPRQSFFSRRRGKTIGAALADESCGSRPEPIVDGDIILDQLPFAFTADAEQDELRGMLLSMQSVGWRRIDVLFGSIMSHEHIIAKRANLDKLLDSGADVVHHVMDTFVL